MVTTAMVDTNVGSLEHVLLVDDDSSNLHLLHQTLNGRGYRLLTAKSGLQALSIAEKMHPVLILLDVMMPGIDGFETCRRLKESQSTADCTVIFLSGLDDVSAKVRGMELGAVDYIEKPFSAEEVVVRVETHLKIHRLEADLADRNRRLEADNERILTAMSEAVFGIDADGQISFVNPAAVEMFGWSEAELLGHQLNSMQLLEACKDDRSLYPLYQSLQDGCSHSSDSARFKRKDGRCFWVEYSSSPVFDNQRVSGAVLVVKDISPRKEAEGKLKQAYDDLEKTNQALNDAQLRLIQAAKLESVGRLAAGVAHEVKNPLAVIQLGLDYLHSDGTEEAVIGEVLDEMGEAVERADTVIRGLLDFSRENRLELQPGDLNQVTRRALKMVEHELIKHHIQLEQSFDDQIGMIELDQNKLQQVFINLFMNAIQAMESDGLLTVKSAVHYLEQDSCRFRMGDRVAVVEVLDTGCGAADEASVFDPFYTTKPTGQGTGLGLSVTRKIIDLHHGSINLVNRPEGGAVVTITLKLNGDKSSKV